jgi:1-acyl-sn-glycerol-3-phosphate acyltransferase
MGFISRAFWFFIALIRALIVFSTMFLVVGSYYLLSFIFKHTEERAFILRKYFLRYIAYPVMNLKVELIGKPTISPALYVSNHRSFADPIVICTYLDAFVIAKAEVAKYPIINKGAELTGVIYVKRDDKDSRSATRVAMVDTMKKGYNILVYPEGTVGTDKLTLDFKKGTFIEASNNDFPIIPIAIEYRDKVDMWTLSNFISQYFKQFSKWRTEVKLHFGEPIIAIDGIEASDKAYDWINGELSSMQTGWSRIFK